MKKGEVQNKETFLTNIAMKLGRERKTDKLCKPNWNYQPQYEVLKEATQDDLVDVLKKQCALIHTQVVETNAEGVAEQVHRVVTEYEGSSIITYDDTRLDEYKKKAEGVQFHKWDPALGEQNIKKAEEADVGIVYSDITIAESGTVVLFSNQNKGRAVSLLPKTFIAIVPKSTIVPRMTQATSMIREKTLNGEQIASCIDFISGPSNSADIELNLVVGVHGPVKATFIIVEDK